MARPSAPLLAACLSLALACAPQARPALAAAVASTGGAAPSERFT